MKDNLSSIIRKIFGYVVSEIKKNKILRGIIAVAIVFSWIFSGWPQIFNFPPKIQEARAAVAFHIFAISSPTTATTTFTITIPSTIAADEDLYVLFVSRDHTSGTALATTTDDDTGGNTWTRIGGSTDRKLNLFWKKSTSGTASKTITVAGCVGSCAGGLSAFTGGAPGNPTTNFIVEDNASADETHAGFAPDVADSFIVFGVTNATNDLDITLLAAATLGSLEPEQWAAESTGGSDCKSTLAGKVNSGTTATGNFTWAQTDAATNSVSFAIKPAPTVALTGTITSSATDANIVAGGKTIILTASYDTWVAAGATFDAQRQNIINGLDSAQSEANGWDAVVKAGQGVSGVVRTSNTVVTITLDAFASYAITATETITATIPATALTGGNTVVATPTFTISLATAVKVDHYRWRNDDGPEGATSQDLYFNPTGNGFAMNFTIVGGCSAGSEWDCVDDGSADTSETAPSSDLETSQLKSVNGKSYYTLANDAIPSGATVTQLDITVSGADDVGNPNTSLTLGYCTTCDGANDLMGTAQAVTGADQTKTQQFTSLTLTTTDLNNMQLVVQGSGVNAEVSTLYVLVTYSVPAATWAQNEDIAHTGLAKSTNIRLRFQADNTGGNASNYNYRLEWAARGADSSCDTSYSQETYAAVPDTATTEHFDMTISGNSLFVDGDPTTAQLSNAESYTFVAGDQIESASNQSGAITLAQNQYTELEYVFQANTNATDGGVYCFRVTNAGTALDSADVIAQVTLAGGAASLTLTIDAGATIEFGTIGLSERIAGSPCTNSCTTRLKIDTDSGSGWNITAGRQHVGAGVLYSAGDSTEINDTSTGINALTDGLPQPCNTDVWPGSVNVSSGLGFTLWASSATKDTTCWGSGSSSSDSSNRYAAFPASTSAAKIVGDDNATPNPSYHSVGYSLEVLNTQKATNYSGVIIYSATTGAP